MFVLILQCMEQLEGEGVRKELPGGVLPGEETLRQEVDCALR